MPIAHLRDLDLSYEVTGDGPPLLLVAGTGFPGSTWTPPVVRAFARDFTVITYDHRGTGTTPLGDEPLSTRLLAADAVALLEHLGLAPAHVLGHSFGGRVAQWMALDRPDALRSLVLAASGAGRPGVTPTDVQAAVDSNRDRIAADGLAGFMHHSIYGFFFSAEGLEKHPEVVQALKDGFVAGQPSDEAFLAHVVARQEHSTLHLLDRVATRTLVLVGKADTGAMANGSHLEQSLAIAERIADAELVVLPRLRHALLWEEPELVTRVVREWVARGEQGPPLR